MLENERGEWELPGGKLEPDETPEDCVTREIAEEVGLKVRPGPLLDAWLYATADGVEVLIITYGCSGTDEEEGAVSSEHRRLGWFRVAEVPALPMPDGYKVSIGRWSRALGLDA